MKRFKFREIGIVLIGLLLFMIPEISHAQSNQAAANAPPVGPPLVREGDFAVKLLSALDLGTTGDEIEAETRLGEAGITPRNGWIADYPVTPDIIGELQKSVSGAVASRRISMSDEEALKALNDVSAALGLSVIADSGDNLSEVKPAVPESYPDPTVINNYYYREGPPVVTYYAPPSGYYYLYAWIPFPFWYSGFWFPGFFVLNDFHRVVVVNKRVVFVSNHYNDVRVHRVYRIDPATRFKGRTYAGIGVPLTKGFISTGVPKSDRKIFHGSRERAVPEGRLVKPPPPAVGAKPPSRDSIIASPPPRGGEAAKPSSRDKRIARPPARGGEAAKPSSRDDAIDRAPSQRDETSKPPSRAGKRPAGLQPRDGETVSPPSHGGERPVERGLRR